MTIEEHMLTTVDNPYNPFTEFDEWNAWDQAQGYHTMSFLARITRTSDELSEADQLVAVENAIDEIVNENVLGLWRKVTVNDYPKQVTEGEVAHAVTDPNQTVDTQV